MISEVSPTVKARWMAYVAATFRYVGLMTAEPTGFNASSEATGKQGRLFVDWGTMDTGSVIQNSQLISFSGVDWGQRITHLALFESVDATTCGMWGALKQPYTISRGFATGDDIFRTSTGVFQIQPGWITIRIR